MGWFAWLMLVAFVLQWLVLGGNAALALMGKGDWSSTLTSAFFAGACLLSFVKAAQ